MTRFEITPEQASHGRVPRDEELPMLAAQWLADGYDSPGLRQLAALSRHEITEASQLLPIVLTELGYRFRTVKVPWDELPWRGYWEQIWWAVDRMDKTHSPYASAQLVLEVLGDVPDLWEPGRGAQLSELLARWDHEPQSRADIDDDIRAHLRSLHEQDLPPLV